jgi:hypothetical protein
MSKKSIFITLLPLLVLSFLTYQYFQEPEEVIENNEPEGVSFIQEGVLVKNNPGLKEGVWYLVYEKPSQPGLNVELQFNEESICFDDDCFDLSSDLVGTRVKIEGLKNDNQVLVYSLEGVVIEEENRQDVARNWILNNSPTYNYDGENLTFIEERGLDLVDCENCYEIEYQFQSRHAGYGDREGENLAQVITIHNIVVLIKEGEVDRVITDQKYDEISEEFLTK